MATSEAIYTWASYRSLDGQPTGVSVKGQPGQVGGWFLANLATATRYVKLYDKATTPSNADTPLLTIALPAGAAANVVANAGIDFLNGIGICVTVGVADNDNTAPTTNDVIVNLLYR